MAAEAFIAASLGIMRATMLPLYRITLLVILMGSPLAAHAAVGAAKPPSDPARYRRCLDDSGSNPGAALADAESWVKSGGGVPADHCAALALVGLKRYAEAAARLDKIAGLRNAQSAEFRVSLFDQAGNAWLLAGDGARAVRSFSDALTLSAGDADLFADLARAQAMVKNWHEVDLDLNAALQLSPRRADLLVLRASARRALQHFEEARSDIEAALKLRPGDGDALVERGLLRKQLGDLGGARRDFQAALKSGSSSAAASARENLGALSP
jgi:tetratricopeptide (TPR) repeat protein